MKVLLSVVSLLLSTALLLVGHGMQLTLLPLRATGSGISDLIIGISASCYFLGFVVGCLAIPRIIARIGHIRGFAVLTAIMVSAILSLEMVSYWPLWLWLRFLTGIAICGLYTVVESWLNSQASASSRGRILAVYTFITLSSMTGGQFLINVGPVDTAIPFMVAALCMALAIIPVGLTRRLAPEPVAPTSTGFSLLFQRSRSAFAGALLSGLVAGSFWSLGAVFAQRYTATQMEVTLFMSAAIAGGAVMQYPIGWLSDRMDRRGVLCFLAIGGLVTSAAVALGAGHSWLLPMVALFGACVMPMYAISLATAADVSDASEFIAIGTTVLLLNALGAAVAALVLGQLMTYFAATALFWSFSLICGLFALYLARQLRSPRVIAVDEQIPFAAAGVDAAPASFGLDPRASEEGLETSADADALRAEPKADNANGGTQPPPETAAR